MEADVTRRLLSLEQQPFFLRCILRNELAGVFVRTTNGGCETRPVQPGFDLRALEVTQMAVNTGRTVYFRSDGNWANKSNDSLRVFGIHITQEFAADEARAMLQAASGGTLTIRGLDGKVQCIQSIVPDAAGPV